MCVCVCVGAGEIRKAVRATDEWSATLGVSSFLLLAFCVFPKDGIRHLGAKRFGWVSCVFCVVIARIVWSYLFMAYSCTLCRMKEKSDGDIPCCKMKDDKKDKNLLYFITGLLKVKLIFHISTNNLN